jgi:hypothetical protein
VFTINIYNYIKTHSGIALTSSQQPYLHTFLVSSIAQRITIQYLMCLHTTQCRALYPKIKFMNFPVILLTSVFPININIQIISHMIMYDSVSTKYKDENGRKEHLRTTHIHLWTTKFFLYYSNLNCVYKTLKSGFWIIDSLQCTSTPLWQVTQMSCRKLRINTLTYSKQKEMKACNLIRIGCWRKLLLI